MAYLTGMLQQQSSYSLKELIDACAFFAGHFLIYLRLNFMSILFNFVSIYTINISFSVYQRYETARWGMSDHNFPPESHKILQRLVTIITHKNPVCIAQVHLTDGDEFMLAIDVPDLISQFSVGQSYMSLVQSFSGRLGVF